VAKIQECENGDMSGLLERDRSQSLSVQLSIEGHTKGWMWKLESPMKLILPLALAGSNNEVPAGIDRRRSGFRWRLLQELLDGGMAPALPSHRGVLGRSGCASMLPRMLVQSCQCLISCMGPGDFLATIYG